MLPVTSSKEAINAGIAAGNINISNVQTVDTMEFSESTVAEQRRHALAMQEAEANRRARAVAVPTSDVDVRAHLRAIGMPVCFFGGSLL